MIKLLYIADSMTTYIVLNMYLDLLKVSENAK